MPVVLRMNGCKFFFFSNEEEEPMHIHVEKGDENGKMWLYPDIEDEYFYTLMQKK